MLNPTFSLFLMHLFKVLFNPINNHLTGDHILTADGDDDVSISLAGLNERLVLQAFPVGEGGPFAKQMVDEVAHTYFKCFSILSIII